MNHLSFFFVHLVHVFAILSMGQHRRLVHPSIYSFYQRASPNQPRQLPKLPFLALLLVPLLWSTKRTKAHIRSNEKTTAFRCWMEIKSTLEKTGAIFGCFHFTSSCFWFVWSACWRKNKNRRSLMLSSHSLIWNDSSFGDKRVFGKTKTNMECI